MAERATFEELTEFANEVRKAGGGNPLEALMPAVPEEPSLCLIAKNLNFNCLVDGAGPNNHNIPYHAWCMWVDNETIRDNIAARLDLNKLEREGEGGWSEFGVVLPESIGQVAADFDSAGQILDSTDWKLSLESLEQGETIDDVLDAFATPKEKKLVNDMLPYIESASAEAFRLARGKTERGIIK